MTHTRRHAKQVTLAALALLLTLTTMACSSSAPSANDTKVDAIVAELEAVGPGLTDAEESDLRSGLHDALAVLPADQEASYLDQQLASIRQGRAAIDKMGG